MSDRSQETRNPTKPDWYPDPTGRHQSRYWDGNSWTDHVADDGIASLDSPSASNGAQVRDLFRTFSTAPTQQILDQVTALVSDSDDPDVTTAVLEAFDLQTSNLGVFGLALQSLGFVRDPRALEYLMERFDDLQQTSQSHPNPQLRSIFADHYLRAGSSIVNLVFNKRDLNPKAIPYLKTIWHSNAFSSGRTQTMALVALENFVPDFPELNDYIKEQERSLS